jgi:ribA/ribD-fused uncharacterized protein
MENALYYKQNHTGTTIYDLCGPFYSTGTDHSSLSNFHQSPMGIWTGWQTVPSVEHAYNASRASIIGDNEWAAKFSDCTKTAAQIKGLSREFKEKMECRRREKALQGVMPYVMRALLYKKFVDPDLATELIATGDSQIWECNPTDDFWGTALRASDFYDGKRPKRHSKNIMGKLLEEVREYCISGRFPVTTKKTVLVGDSNVSRLQRHAYRPNYDMIAFSGGQIDLIIRLAEAIIHPGISNIIIMGGTNNLEVGYTNTSNNPNKLAQNIIGKLMRIAKRNPAIRVAFLEILPRMKEGQSADLLCASWDTNRRVRERLNDPKYGAFATMIQCEGQMDEEQFFNMKYPGGNIDGIHLNPRGARKLECIINMAIRKMS